MEDKDCQTGIMDRHRRLPCKQTQSRQLELQLQQHPTRQLLHQLKWLLLEQLQT